MERVELAPPAGLFGRARRFLDHLRAARPEMVRPARQSPPSYRLHELTLQIAGCCDLRQELPNLLQPLEQALNLEPGLQEECRLLVAATLTGAADPAIIHTTKQDLPVGITALLRYQLSGPLQGLKPHHPHLFLLPGGELGLHIYRLGSAELGAWLVVLGEGAISIAMQKRLSAIADAVEQGIEIWHTHQQRVDLAINSERRAHAAELHDSLAQILGYLRLTTSRLDARCSKCNQPELQALASDLSQQTRHAYRLMRDLISSSRLTLEGGSLHTALHAAVTEYEQRSGLVFELDDRCQRVEPDENTAIQLVMIVREALCNAVRHAHASHLRVQLLPNKQGGILLRIEDNGQGIDPARRRHDSFGLGIMQERAARLGAVLNIGDRPGGGTRLDLNLDRLDR